MDIPRFNIEQDQLVSHPNGIVVKFDDAISQLDDEIRKLLISFAESISSSCKKIMESNEQFCCNCPYEKQCDIIYDKLNSRPYQFIHLVKSRVMRRVKSDDCVGRFCVNLSYKKRIE